MTVSAPLTGWASFRAYLEMIKFEHSIFALPFAMVGMMWGSVAARDSLWPGWEKFGLIVLAMVSCRSAAMAFNRIVDRQIDAKNARTAIRAIPAGILGLRQVHLFFAGSVGLFLVAAALLNPLALALSPVALLVTLGYSYTKRFTPLCHLILGLSLAIAPAAAFIGVTGTLDPRILSLVFAVMGWTAGFDILYSLQDEEFDRREGLYSMPVWLGRVKALWASRLLHALTVGLLIWTGFLWSLGPLYFAGVAVAAGLLLYEQSLVKPDDLSRINLAFFTLNGWVSLGFFVFALLDGVLS